MATLSLFKGKTRFAGAWSSAASYAIGDVVTATDNGAYRCVIDGTTGAGHNPTTDSTNWALVLTAAPMAVSAAYQTDVSATTYSIAAGSTWQWRGQEWNITAAGNTVTLHKVKMNCDCNCNCNCSWIDCDCYTAACACNCNCDCICILWNCQCMNFGAPTGANCFSICSAPDIAAGDCNCNCNCNAYNCATNCDCSYQCDCDCSPV
ncbi:MAG: hypothetical protein WCJ66_04515 [Verrucomicrobiota bacterium]